MAIVKHGTLRHTHNIIHILVYKCYIIVAQKKMLYNYNTRKNNRIVVCCKKKKVRTREETITKSQQ